MTQNVSLEALLQQGHEQLEQGQYEAAIPTFQQAAKPEPQNLQALCGLGLAFYRLEQYQESVEHLNQALQIKPDYILALALRGLAYQKLELNEQATADFEQAIQIEPKDYEDWRGRGIALDQLQRYEEAIASYDKAIEIKPDEYLAWNNRGVSLFYLGRFEEAITSSDKAVEINPDIHAAWCYQGAALFYLGRFEEAITSFDKAVEIKPDIHAAWYYRGGALGNLGRYEEAIASYDKAIEIQPDDYAAWYYRALALNDLGRYEEAIASYDKAIEIKPDNQDAWYHRGYALSNLGHYEEAIVSFDKAIAIQPGSLLAWYNQGIALSRLEHYEEALASFDKAIAIQPDLHEAWYNRGMALGELGRYKEALTSFEQALTIQPDLHEAWYSRGIALRDLGRYEEAIASFEQVLTIQPNYHLAWINRGAVLCDNLGRYKEALTNFNQAVTIKPGSRLAWHNRGEALLKLGRYEEALTSCDQALAIQADLDEICWHNRGLVLDELGRYEAAIASYDQALAIKPDYHKAWMNRGNAAWMSRSNPAFLSSYTPVFTFPASPATKNPALNHRGYEGALASFQEGLKYCHQNSHPDGWGLLHLFIGRVHYLQGQPNPSFHHLWWDARAEYNLALQTLTAESFPELHLELLEDLIKVCRALGSIKEANKWLNRGIALLEQLIADTRSEGKKLLLARKFNRFYELRVDAQLQSGDIQKALELAEERKHLCLRWLRENRYIKADPDSPNYTEIQQLLNPHIAAIYWHVSPAAITTFILRHNQPPQVHSTLVTGDDGIYPTATLQLRDFENWVKAWKENYQDYRAGKEKGTEEKLSTVEGKKPAPKDHPWRKEMTAALEELKTILDIPGIVPHLSGIHHLILIPHRDLHLLPLHDLFPEDFTITYLPSAQIGLDLQKPRVNPGQRLLNVENPQQDLRYATVESAAISLLYPDSTLPIKGQKATRIQVMTTMQTDEQLGVFHFTGHGQHDINQPLESSLLLAGEDKLTLRDIFQLDLSRYHLICLSACETALTSKQGLIDEFVGLVSGFLAKGATYVVSTLWAVDEYSTALLMVRFYQCLQANMTPPDALKEAQKWLRTVTHPQLIEWYQNLADQFEGKNSEIQFYLNRQVNRLQKNSATIDADQPLYEHPYYWAGFTVTGKV